MTMTTHPLIAGSLALGLAYLIGSIPFGYVIARVIGGVDIRTVGSGNIGATNVGRVLGFRFFVVVFLLDFAKGFLPTRFLPDWLGLTWPDLPVGVAVAAILGHNFPVYLGFKGGKGVATSLGAVSALDAIASAAAAGGFGLLLGLFRYVSVASLGGGLGWIGVHFARTSEPWRRDQVALSVASMGLMILLIARHRKNLARLAAGTEPKVSIRRSDMTLNEANTESRRAGRVVVPLLIALTGAGVLAGLVASGLAWSMVQKAEVVAGPYHAEEVARVATGHQRAEHLVFADGGQFLAASCPRYDRVMLYRVTPAAGLNLVADINVGGRPVALAAGRDRVYVLTRPANDARHIHEGWWEAFDFQGKSVTARHPVGLYPDDFALVGPAQDPRLLVLTSGRGEGDPKRPAAALTSYAGVAGAASPTVESRTDFAQPGDDPGRLAVTADGRTAAVSIVSAQPAVVWLDLSDLSTPKIVARRAWPESSRPDNLRFDEDGSLLATDDGNDLLWHQASAAAKPTSRPVEGGAGDVITIHQEGRPDYWAYTLPFDSGLAFLAAGASNNHPHARLPLLGGRAKLSATRPVGLAVAPGRGLIAVANRSGGSVHLIALKAITR